MSSSILSETEGGGPAAPSVSHRLAILLSARDEAADNAALQEVVRQMQSGQSPTADLEEAAAWAQLRADPRNGAIVSRLCSFMRARGAAWAEMERLGLALIFEAEPNNTSIAATLALRYAAIGEDLPLAVALAAFNHYAAQVDYPKGAVQWLAGAVAMAGGQPPWRLICQRLLAWSAGLDDPSPPLDELLTCAALLGLPVEAIEVTQDDDLARLWDHLASRGKAAPRSWEIAELQRRIEKGLNGPDAARLTSLLHDAGQPTPWRVERAALIHHLRETGETPALAARLLQGMAANEGTLGDPLVEPRWIALALEHFLAMKDYPRGALAWLVPHLARKCADALWGRISSRLLDWSQTSTGGIMALSEFVECAEILQVAGEELSFLDPSRLSDIYDHNRRIGRASPYWLERRVLDDRLKAGRLDEQSAVQLINLLTERGEPVPWNLERAALNARLAESGNRPDHAAHLLQRLVLHGETPSEVLIDLALPYLVRQEGWQPRILTSTVKMIADRDQLPPLAKVREAIMQGLVAHDADPRAAGEIVDLAALYQISVDEFLGGAPDCEPAEIRPFDVANLADWRRYLRERDWTVDHVPRLGPFLESQPPAPQVLRPNLKLKLYSTRLAAASDLPSELIAEFTRRVLQRVPGQTASKILDKMNVLPSGPGSAYLDVEAPVALLEFMEDAWSRGRTARDRGDPIMPMFSMSKSGSSYSAAFTARLLDIPAGVVSVDHAVGFPAWLRFAAQFPIALHDHTILSVANLRLLRDLGVQRIGLQVRDPRQCLLSLAHHDMASPIDTVPGSSDLLRAKGFEAYFDLIIESFAAEYAAWAATWKRRAARAGVEIRFFKHEVMAAKPRDFFGDMLDFFGATDATRSRMSAAMTGVEDSRKGGDLNFRSGKTDEWRTVLTPAQVRRITEICEDSFSGIYEF